MEEWKEYKLGDVASVQTGPFGSQLHNKDYVKNGTPIVTVEHLGSRMFTTQNLPCVSDSDKTRLWKYTLKEGDIVFSRVGSVDRCSFVSKKEAGWLFSGRCLRVRCNGSIHPMYLYYCLQQEEVKQSIRNIAVGATMPSINTKLLSEIQIIVPPKASQQRIALFLSFLDDKIECNKRINDNLEQQAQALFKSWFVDFELFKDGEFEESELGIIPKGWRVGKLSEIADIKMGVSPSGTSYNTDGVGEVFYQGRAEFGFRFPKRNMYTTEAKRIAEADAVLVSVRAPVGDINVAEERCCIGRGLASVNSKHNCNSFILYLMQSLKPVFDRFNGEGTVFGSINKKAFEELQVLIPNETTIVDYESIANSIDRRIKKTEQESCRLAQLRDTLLPKLMSGELKVNEID